MKCQIEHIRSDSDIGNASQSLVFSLALVFIESKVETPFARLQLFSEISREP
jgi:hypothetical protein